MSHLIGLDQRTRRGKGGNKNRDKRKRGTKEKICQKKKNRDKRKKSLSLFFECLCGFKFCLSLHIKEVDCLN